MSASLISAIAYSVRDWPLRGTLSGRAAKSASALRRRDAMFAFSPEVRKILYTTIAIESLHSQVRKAIWNKGHFPSDEAITKLTYLALRNITAVYSM